MLLLKNSPVNVVLVRESAEAAKATSTFDYSDLNAYLLIVVGLAKPEDDQVALFQSLSSRAQERTAIPLRDIQSICRKETLVTLPASENLSKAIEVFGSGIHRILVTNEAAEVVGVLNQLRLVEFFWNEGVNFPNIERLYPVLLRDWGIGTQQTIAINSDSPLADALTLMSEEGLTSVAVVDNGRNVVGNISTVDVKHLTNAASVPLLDLSCMNFVSVILNERGVEKGRDTLPVFYVNPYSTLAHTVAKLVATQSHRMWVVESASPSPSAPATPLLAPTPVVQPSSTVTHAPLQPSGQAAISMPAASLPGASISGRLTGVISLSDILNLFARSTGLNPSDPGEQRARRRRSSSSSVRPSLDGSRASFDLRR
jgi:CBS domain-containing protein